MAPSSRMGDKSLKCYFKYMTRRIRQIVLRARSSSSFWRQGWHTHGFMGTWTRAPCIRVLAYVCVCVCVHLTYTQVKYSLKIGSMANCHILKCVYKVRAYCKVRIF